MAMSEHADDEDTDQPLPEPEPTSSRKKSRGPTPIIVGLGVGVLIIALVLSNVVLWSSLKTTQSDLTRTRRKVSRVESGSVGVLRDVANRVDSLESQLGDASFGSDDVASRVDDVELRVDDVESGLTDLQDCVNSFLRGFDAANGGFFRYQFC